MLSFSYWIHEHTSAYSSIRLFLGEQYYFFPYLPISFYLCFCFTSFTSHLGLRQSSEQGALVITVSNPGLGFRQSKCNDLCGERAFVQLTQRLPEQTQHGSCLGN